MWFIGVEEEQETSALHPKKNPGSAPELWQFLCIAPVKIGEMQCSELKLFLGSKSYSERFLQ